MLIQHHTKYKELHGVDEVVMMTMSDHVKLHNRLRREGKCTVSSKRLREISHRARMRSEKGRRDHLKVVMEYESKNVKHIAFHNQIGVGISLVERISYNSKTGSAVVSHWFHPTKGRMVYIDI